MLKSIIKKSTRVLGFDINRYQPSSSDVARFMAMLKDHKVNVIFDIGANTGQFGTQLRNASYKGRIVSFEPLTSAHKKLLSISAKDAMWDVAPAIAIGNEEGEVEIHIANNSVSSSILKMLKTHSNAAPKSSYIGTEIVPMKKLDSVSKDYIKSGDVYFLKIDTQGYEDRVLQGAKEMLSKAIGVQLELSLVPLYEGQKLFNEMVLELNNQGFELWDIATAFVDPKSGRSLQVDATFFRR